MTRPVSHTRVIGAIVRKDLAEYGRDRLWAFLTVMVLVVVVALFWLLPDSVSESIQIGVVGGDGALHAVGLEVVSFDSADDLEAVVAGKADAWNVNGTAVVRPPGVDGPQDAESAAVEIGIVFPDDFVAATSAGRRSEVTVFVDAATPIEIQTAVSAMVRQLAYAIAGEQLPTAPLDPAQTFVVLGEDRVGDQATARDNFRPVFVFLILLMEMFVMASLIAKEIQARTVTAMLVTPATVADVLAAKGVAATLSGMAQAVVVLVAIDSLSQQPVLILTLMLLGSIMVAGTAMLAGSTGRDFMGTLFNGMLFMIPMIIPAFSALFPGTASTWIRALPSYPLVEGLVNVTTYGHGWTETLPELAALLAWCVVLFAAGWFVLRRKVRSL